MPAKRLVALGALVFLALSGAAWAGGDVQPPARPWLKLEPFVAKRLVLKKDLLDGLRTYLAGRLTEARLYRVLTSDKVTQAELSMRVEILKLGNQCTILAATRKMTEEADEDVVTARAECTEDALVAALDMIVAKLSAVDEPFLDSPREQGIPAKDEGRPAKRAAR
jgi:hypothetical protein